MSILAPGIFGNPAKTLEAYETYRSSGPYPHCNINPITEHAFMRAVHDEITTNMKANFKETDLFKVFQTDELATLDSKVMKKTMPHLLQLRTALYSKEFRTFVQSITGCGELTERVDLSSNAYANSCHLLCHDDVIGTRRISFILYLSDPDEEWHAEDGGAIELYPLEGDSVVFHPLAGPQGVPTALPSATVLPHFNSILFFTVLPGRSYHSVQEVFAKDRPRLSISGWYHGPEAPAGAESSSLQLIMSRGDSLPNALQGTTVEKEDGSFVHLSVGDELTASDRRKLSGFISEEYLSVKGMAAIAKQFVRESSVQLYSFLTKDWSDKVLKQLVKLDQKDGLGKGQAVMDWSIGLGDGWTVRGPAHKRRYCAFANGSEPTGLILQQLLDEFLSSEAFGRYLQAVTSLALLAVRAEIRRFRAGLDYTVAHYGCLTKESRLDATLCFVNDDREAEQAILGNKKKRKHSTAAPVAEEDGYDSDYAGVWEDGEVGAFECYIEADQDAADAEAAEVYRVKDDEAEGADKALLSVGARQNSLSIVLRDEGLMKFIKYTSANAPGSRYDISMEYVIDKQDDDGEGSEEEEEEEGDSEEEESDV